MAEVHMQEDKGSLCAALGKWVADVSAACVAERGRFAVAISGGSMPAMLALALTQPPLRDEIQWDKWYVLFADERCVPLDHDDSNYKSAFANFLSKVRACVCVCVCVRE
jgi:6-phosphogluconolactonase